MIGLLVIILGFLGIFAMACFLHGGGVLIISSIIGVSILSFLFFGISNILQYLEELGAGKKEETDNPKPAQIQPIEEPMENGDWVCPKCGKIKKSYVGTCGNCGYTKCAEDFWECPECHISMPNNQKNECLNCHYKP